MRAIHILAGATTAVALSASALPGWAQSIWAQAPWPSEVLKAYPAAAPMGEGATVRLKCVPDSHGLLGACTVLSESTPGHGWAEAALGLSKSFRLTPQAAQTYTNGVVLPVRFEPRTAAPPWREVAFGQSRFSGRFPEFGPIGGYYPDRAARGGVEAEVLIDCQAPMSKLESCRLFSVSPPDFGFEDSVERMIKDGYLLAGPAPGPAPEDGVWRFRIPFALKR